jgi:hypothetical protein
MGVGMRICICIDVHRPDKLVVYSRPDRSRGREAKQPCMYVCMHACGIPMDGQDTDELTSFNHRRSSVSVQYSGSVEEGQSSLEVVLK